MGWFKKTLKGLFPRFFNSVVDTDPRHITPNFNGVCEEIREVFVDIIENPHLWELCQYCLTKKSNYGNDLSLKDSRRRFELWIANGKNYYGVWYPKQFDLNQREKDELDKILKWWVIITKNNVEYKGEIVPKWKREKLMKMEKASHKMFPSH